MPIRHMLLAAMITLLWGGNFIVSKFGMHYLPPFLLSSIRFAAVGLVLIPFVPRPSKKDWRPIALMSFVLGTCHLALVLSGMNHGLDIATTVITIQLGTPFACALGAIFFNDKLGPWRTGGLMVAFIGIIVVVGTPSVSQNYLGFLLTLAAALAFGGATILMRQTRDIPILSVLGWMSLMTVPQTLLISFLFENPSLAMLQDAPLYSWLAISYSVFCSTILAYGSWYWLLARYEVSQVTPFALLVPIFGISMGQIFYHEGLSVQTMIGGLITIIGVGIIIIRRPRTAELG